jgi:hypothetical protein
VKTLAEQTAKATGEISQQISGIQTATQEFVSAIRDISATIERLSEVSSTIAAAVEEQGAATQEISRNVQQAAHGTQQVSTNITDVQARRGRDRLGLLAGAFHRQDAGDRQQPAEGRSREVLADRACRVSLRGGFGRRARYRASRKPNAMTNSTAVMMTAVAAPAAILAFSLAVVERMGPRRDG